jgi:hypothetical protein
MKKLKNSVLAVSLVASSLLYASETINLQSGWNLVGVSQTSANMNVADMIRDKNVSLIVTYDNGWKKYDPNRSYLQQFSQLKAGQGYWIKSNADSNITINGISTISMPVLKAGWNLAAFGNAFNMDELVNTLTNQGYKLDLMVTFNGGWKKYDPNRSYLQQFHSIDTSAGYWVKTEKLAGVATTADGYSVKLFVDNENADVSNLEGIISTYSLTDLSNIQSQFANVSNIVVSTTKNGQELDSSYINPSDSSFSTALNDTKTQFESNNPTAQSGGTSLYVYGLSEGGSPFILSEAKIYKANTDGSEGDYLGTTSQLGYLYLSDVTNGEKVIVEKDGFDSTVQTLNVVSGGANYIFLSQDDGSGEYSGANEDTTTQSGRLLNRVLNAWNAQVFSARRGAGALLTPTNSRIKAGARLKIRPTSLTSLPDYDSLSSDILNMPGYNVYALGSLKLYARKPFHFGYRMGVPFNDIMQVQDGANLNQIEVAIKATIPDVLKPELLGNDGNYDVNKTAAFANNIAVYQYKDSSWQEIPGSAVSFKINGFSTDFNSMESRFLNRNHNVGYLITVDGSEYTGAYPLIAVYKKAVNITPSVIYHDYGLNVKVTDTDGNPISNALVKLTRGSGGTEVVNYADNNGTAHFDLHAAEGAIEDISLDVMAGNRYPASRTLNISSLAEDANTTVTVSLEAPPAYGTVKGEVTDSNRDDIVNAKVKLLYPIALADVQKDVTKVIDNKEVKGLSVGLVPNAKYKWYIKVHSDTDNNTQSNPRLLNRVSSQRWILVKSDTAANNGNFLPYDKIVSQAIALPHEGDPSDIGVIPAAQFDVAVEVDHDIDADGHYDFVELATTPAAQDNLSGEEFSSNVNNNYGKTIGFVSTVINVQKIIKHAGGIQIPNDKLYVKSADLGINDWHGYDEIDANEFDTAVNQTLINEEEADEAGYYNMADNMKFSLTNNNYLLVQDDTFEAAHDYNYTSWDMALSATVQLANGSESYVKLKKVNNEYKWVNVDDPTVTANNEPYFIHLKTDTFTGINFEDLGRALSQNKIFAKLAENMQAIANEANIAGTLQNPENSLMKDGFNASVIPTMTVTTNQTAGVGAGKVIKLRKVANIAIGGNDAPIKDYISLDRVDVDAPAMTQSEQTTHSDRVGLYQFSAVPLSYGQMNVNDSLLRVTADKLGFYEAPVTDVPKFTQDNTATAIREDVQRVDLSMDTKPTYNVEVNVTDTNGNPINNAVVIIDGVMSSNNTDLSESQSLQAQEGSDVTFNNVIGGRGSSRIIRVSVPDTHYIPVIKTLRNLNADKVVNVQLVNADLIADYAPAISVIDSSFNPSNGIATITVDIEDKNDGSTTVKPAQVYVTNNGEVSHANIRQDGSEFTISLPLNVGSNSIVIEAANSKGISDSSPVSFDYNPNIGSVNGVIRGFTDNNSDGRVDNTDMLVLDIFDANGMYINTAMPADDGRYVLEDLPAGEQYKLQALEINANGNIINRSDLVPVTIAGGQLLNVDITMQPVPQDTGVTGSPVFDLIGDLANAPISSTGEMNVSATISNFDPDNGGKVAFVVNDRIVRVDSSNLNSEGNHSYNIQNFTIQLQPGNNIIYGVAQNPDGSFDWTADISKDWEVNNSATTLATLNLTLNVCEESNVTNCSPFNDPNGAEVYISDVDGNYVADGEVNASGSGSIVGLLPSEYYVNVYPNSADYSRAYDRDVNLTEGNNQVEVNLTKFADTVTIPPYDVSNIELNATDIEVNKTYTATAIISGEDNNYSTDNGYSYSWNYVYNDENGTEQTVPLSCNDAECVFSIPQTGYTSLNVYVAKGDQNKTSSTGFTVQEIVVPEPPQVPNI